MILPQGTQGTGADPKACIQLCLDAKMSYAGIVDKNKCWCNNWQGDDAQADASECSRKCDDGWMCGGTDRMSVYKLPQKYEIMGCFTEGSPAELFAPRTVTVGNSAWACVDECERVGYHYAGITSSGPRCSCAYDFGKYGRKPGGSCDLVATDTTSIGGSGHNTVYRTIIGRNPHFKM
eukprot:GHVU01116704.1.p1 GENE.GHVU01116704.1~~GHVU01116704.1.p1  ORF type:complete len:178 (+),score=17.13 GHVU01116704.1:499-1032(+)